MTLDEIITAAEKVTADNNPDGAWHLSMEPDIIIALCRVAKAAEMVRHEYGAAQLDDAIILLDAALKGS